MNRFINQERKEGSVGFGVLSYLPPTCLCSNSGDPTPTQAKYNFYVKYLVNQCFFIHQPKNQNLSFVLAISAQYQQVIRDSLYKIIEIPQISAFALI